jgi:hypothetical protein
MGIPTFAATATDNGGSVSGTYTASPTANRIGVYLYGGKGGDGAGNNYGFTGGAAGMGGFGFWNKPITQPFSVPYSIGGDGAGGTAPMYGAMTGNPGGSGGATTLTNVGTANGGVGGVAPPTGADVNNASSPGNAPGANLVAPNRMRNMVVGVKSAPLGTNAGSQNANLGQQNAAILIFENIGT